VVLIDEFQDTDRVQWHLFQHAFVGGEDAPAVVLVGDPKQSIYRFRGAELSAYLDARSAAASVRSLSVNRRSDGPLLEGLDRLFRGFTFGSDDVEFQPVEPADANRSSRLEAVALGADGAASPIELRMVPPGADKLASAEARRAVMADLVAVTGRLLGSVPHIDEGDAGRRPLCARDIAVLVRSNADANRVVAALADTGIAAATAGATSVLDTEAAQQWRLVLRALERPGSQRAARTAALSWFMGHSAAEVAAFTDTDLAGLHERLGEWSALLASRGVAAFFAATRAHGLGARVLARRGGERHLTDLEHITELLQTATGARPASAASLRRLLADAAAFGNVDDADSVVSRRIDRDDDAVQVLTAHRAKGLEYPVVLCPTLWAAPGSRASVKHASVPGGRLIDASWVAGSDDTRAAAELLAAAKAEAAGEERRLLYVALTRAKHRCVLWWAPVSSGTGVLGDLLQHALGTTAPPASLADLRPLAESSGGTIGVTSVRAGVPPTPRADDDTAEPVPLAAATTDRVLDRAWRVWSFSGVKAVADAVEFDQPVQGGTDEPALADAVPGEPGLDEPGLDEPGVPPRVRLPLADAPGGTEFGTLVHQVLEQVDFTSATLFDDLTERCAASLQYRSLRIGAADLAAGLQAAIEAPLGGPVGSMRLADLAPADRLNELDFDLPLGRLTAARIGTVLAQHLPADDLLAPWAQAMAGGAYDFPLDGVLTGSIDLVARSDGGTRFWVADYKTNQLGRDNPYGRTDLAAAMAHHHYPLQAALYLVALHRMLRWRLPGYRPDTHLGGAAYLFVRGMVPAAPSTDARGVFWWQPPSAAVEALDRLLAGESSDA
jgi:exodeoxyribonuclease V beta subunit